jgi:hypothetical protein
VTEDQRTLIVTVDLRDVGSHLTVDIGSLAPHIAASVLRAAAEDLECYQPQVTVIHEGEPIWGHGFNGVELDES